MKKNTKPTETKPRRQVVVIESFKQLQDMCEAMVPCRFELDGRVVEVQVRRLSPAVKEEVYAIMRAPQPPPVKGDPTKYNNVDPAFLASMKKAELLARALVVYSGCPAIASGKPGLTDKEQIFQFIRTFASDVVLDVIAGYIQESGLGELRVRDVEDRANFTPPPASES